MLNSEVFDTEHILSRIKLFWQYPVITEKTFYEQNYKDPEYIGFPWATVIDKRYNPSIIYNLIKNDVNNLECKYTCCQSIYFRSLIPLFKKLNITTLYTSHKKIGEDVISGIILKPCPLYAVNYEDENRNNVFKNMKLDKKYLYSFQGAYDHTCYLTDIRKRIFEMEHPSDCCVKYINQWHFHDDVYSPLQNVKMDLNENETDKERTDAYNKLLLQSRYSLCPSGSGPNSIRFWECLAIGTIPVLLADTLELPCHELWDKAIVRVPESNLHKLPDILSVINTEKETEMSLNCIKIYNHFRNNYKNI